MRRNQSLTDLIQDTIKNIEALVYMTNTKHLQPILKGNDGHTADGTNM
jgi:hypothetical protein